MFVGHDRHLQDSSLTMNREQLGLLYEEQDRNATTNALSYDRDSPFPLLLAISLIAVAAKLLATMVRTPWPN